MKRILKLQHCFAIALIVTALPTQAGSIARLVYDDIPGATVATLTNSPIFPDGPTFREQLDDFTLAPNGTVVNGFQGKDNSGNNFGALIRGYLEAPVSGEYRFFLASDDASELWLGTDESVASRKQIAFESVAGAPLFAGARLAERQSAAIPLVRGKKYYLEVFHKQSAGTSYVQVGWQRPDGVQEIIPARHLAQFPVDPFLGQWNPNLPPGFNENGLNGGDLPSAVTASEGEDVLLELDVIAAQPTTIEWRRNGVAIPGENLSFLDLPRIPATRNGQTIQAIISNSYGSLTSAAVRLSINADVIPPAISSVEPQGNPNQVTVSFSEPVARAQATNLANYVLKSAGGTILPIQSAVLLPDDRTVRLSGNFGFVLNGQYELTVRDIDDQAAIPNRLLANPTLSNLEFTGEFIGPIGFAANNPLQNQSAVENRSTRFEVLLSGAKPWFYQWERNGAAIPDATNAVLEVIATANAVGDSYRVTVSNEFSRATSQAVQLTTLPDRVAPKLAAIRGIAGVNEVRFTFDEPLSSDTATNMANYQVGTLSIQSAALSSDGRTVTLRIGPLQKGATYLTSIAGLKDQSVAGNTLSTTASFVAEVDYAGEVLADSPVRYWHFNEPSGTGAASVATGIDLISATTGAIENNPALGVPGLVPSAPEDTAIQFAAAASQRIIVPNGSDLNAKAGPWAKKTIEFWFRAASAPISEATGLAATAGIWEQGAATRSIAVYLWRDPNNPNPDEAELVFHAFNSGADGPGAPFGLTQLPAVFVKQTILIGRTYYVAAVFDGDSSGVAGNLILYVDGVEAGRAVGVGQIYNHTGDVQIGRGNGAIHTGGNGDFGFFDGVIDELSIYNKALSAERVEAHYQAGLGAPGSSVLSARIQFENGALTITWEGSGRIESSSSVQGPYEAIPSASSPYSSQTSDKQQRFFRVVR